MTSSVDSGDEATEDLQRRSPSTSAYTWGPEVAPFGSFGLSDRASTPYALCPCR